MNEPDSYPDGARYWQDMERALDEDREKLAALESGDFWRSALEHEGYPPVRESARRSALFRKVESTMTLMVALRGVYSPPIAVTAWYGRHGRRLGLCTYYDADHEIQWTPRGGFKIIKIENPPF